MKLYALKYSRSYRVFLLLRYLGVEADYIPAFTNEGGEMQRNPELDKANIVGRIPTLIDDSVTYRDSLTIAIYLSEKYERYDLLPQLGDPHRYEVLAWLSFVCSDLDSVLFNAYVNKSRYPQERFCAWRDEQYREEYLRLGGVMNTVLEDREFLAGDVLSVADIYMAATSAWLDLMDYHEPNHKALAAYLERLKKQSFFAPPPDGDL